MPNDLKKTNVVLGGLDVLIPAPTVSEAGVDSQDDDFLDTSDAIINKLIPKDVPLSKIKTKRPVRTILEFKIDGHN